MGRLILSEMTWEEVAKEIPNVQLALIPIGSCEQHGPNSTFETDTARAYEFCKLLAERVGNKVLVCPPVAVGMSPHHMDFPGTMTLSVSTMIDLLTDLAISISKHGIGKVLFVNGHGGNRACLDAAITRLRYESGVSAYWSGMGSPIAKKAIKPGTILSPDTGHACEIETSQAMFLAPWTVRADRQLGKARTESVYWKKPFIDGGAAWNWRYDVSENGALGNAMNASTELGEEMTDYVLDYFEQLVDTIISH